MGNERTAIPQGETATLHPGEAGGNVSTAAAIPRRLLRDAVTEYMGGAR